MIGRGGGVSRGRVRRSWGGREKEEDWEERRRMIGRRGWGRSWANRWERKWKGGGEGVGKQIGKDG